MRLSITDVTHLKMFIEVLTTLEADTTEMYSSFGQETTTAEMESTQTINVVSSEMTEEVSTQQTFSVQNSITESGEDNNLLLLLTMEKLQLYMNKYHKIFNVFKVLYIL